MEQFGFLNELLEDESITEIMINGPSLIFIERGGNLFPADKHFDSDKDLYQIIDAILKPLGKWVNAETPFVDARLPDGSRVNIIIPPVSLTSPMITIRKFQKDKVSGNYLISSGSLSRNMIEFMKLCVECKKNIVVSGGTGSGKTTLLNILSSFIPENERVITIEDIAELQLHHKNIGRLEAQLSARDGQDTVTIRRLLINALRMRPDRLIIGECRGGEAFDMLQAMNTGHQGSMSTVHANSPRDCLKRLETMVLMAGFDLPVRVIREQIASAINILIQTSRMNDGTRKVITISEITGMEGDIITLLPLFEYTPAPQPSFIATQAIPGFMEEARQKGIFVDLSLFK